MTDTAPPSVDVKCNALGPIYVELEVFSKPPNTFARAGSDVRSELDWCSIRVRDACSSTLCDVRGRSLSAAFECAAIMLRGVV